MKRFLPAVLAGLLSVTPLLAGLVPAGRYVETALQEIDDAKKSVHVFLYLFGHNPARPNAGPGKLFDALVRAQKRGVQVEVLLDARDQPFSEGDRNLIAAEALRAAGVPVSYVEGKVLHAKALVVDGKTLILGSSNWTTAAFENNAEADVRIESAEAAQALIARMAALPREAPPAPTPDGAFRVPVAFVTSADKMAEMVRGTDNWALDAYIYVLSLNISTEEFQKIDRAAALAALGYREKSLIVDKVRLRRPLERLQKKYGLLEYRAVGDETEVRLKALPGPGFSVPKEYVAFGWPARLKPGADMAYLISAYQSSVSPISPRWSLPQRTLAQRHGSSIDAVNQGIVELRRQNLIEVKYDAQPSPDDPARLPNVYSPNAPYDPAQNAARLEKLRAQHGKPAVKRAQAVAEMLYEDNDVGIVEQLVGLEKQYGEKTVAEAAKLLGEKRPDNPKRNFGYLIGTIRGLAEKVP